MKQKKKTKENENYPQRTPNKRTRHTQNNEMRKGERKGRERKSKMARENKHLLQWI